MSETDCCFDCTTWRDLPPPVEPGKAIPGFAAAWQISMQTHVRLARFTRLARRARRLPENIEARVDAVELAQTLLHLRLEPWIETLIENGTLRVGRTSEVHVRKMVKRSFDFPSTDLLLLLLQYWEARFVVCACVQRICELPLSKYHTWPWRLAEASGRCTASGFSGCNTHLNVPGSHLSNVQGCAHDRPAPHMAVASLLGRMASTRSLGEYGG